MKIFFSFAFAIIVAQLPLVGSEKMEEMKVQQPMPRHMRGGKSMHKGPWHGRHHRGQHHDGMHRRGPGRSDMMFENLNKDQQGVYTEIRNLQNTIRKNMHALGQERRNIKNLTTGDARKKAQENINQICNEIKSNLEEHQPRIVGAIGELQ